LLFFYFDLVLPLSLNCYDQSLPVIDDGCLVWRLIIYNDQKRHRVLLPLTVDAQKDKRYTPPIYLTGEREMAMAYTIGESWLPCYINVQATNPYNTCTAT